MNYSALLQTQTSICPNAPGASDVVSLVEQMNAVSYTRNTTTVFSSILIRKKDQKLFEFMLDGQQYTIMVLS